MKIIDVMQDLAEKQNYFRIMKHSLTILHHLRNEYCPARNIITTKIHAKIIQ